MDEAGIVSLFGDITPQRAVGYLVIAPMIALSLTLHEYWHAYSAELLGDPTGKYQGRCTLNPLAHLDPIGTLALFIGPVGWARPVPINPLNFRDPSRGMMLSVAAGPLSNLGLAVVAGLLLRLLAGVGVVPDVEGAVEGSAGPGLLMWSYAGLYTLMSMNVFLFLFNLIPLYPLDGHHLVRENLRGEARRRFIETQHLGVYVLAGLIVLPYLIGGESLIGRVIGRPAEKLMLLAAGREGLIHGLESRLVLSGYFPW